MTYPDSPEHTAETAARARELAVARGERYLAIFEPGSSRVVTLPHDGELVIGRSTDASLRLDDPSVSRRHAKLLIEGGRAFVVDLESQNGTFVDGELVVGPRPLSSGEVIELSQSAIVFHDARTPPFVEHTVSGVALREQLAIELARAEVTDRPPGVLVVLREPCGDATTLGAYVARLARGLERVAEEGAHRAVLLAPELDLEELGDRGRELGRRLASLGVSCRVGAARAPADGCDAETLLASARAAASLAAPSTVLPARDAMRTITLGDQTAIVADAAMLRVYALAERLAASALPVLVHGETGSGKEMLALALHHLSPTRGRQRLVSLNCAALTETLVESELFGHERGAFTGATSTKVGLLEVASSGTVFLDEVAELSPSTQAKLLRALDARRIVRLGDTRERPIDVRVVAATHEDLAKQVSAGRFRSDLYFRLSGATLWVPPLRDRPRELILLARRFLDDACRRAGRAPMRATDDAIRALAAYPWPGNVRELRYVMEYVVAAFDDPMLETFHLEDRLGRTVAPAQGAPRVSPSFTSSAPVFRPIEDEVRELEIARMRAALAASDGNQKRAAQLIQMPLRTFVTKLARYGLR